MNGITDAQAVVERDLADINVLVLGDSTANDSEDWVYQFGLRLGEMHSTHDILYQAYSGSAWGAESTLSSGSGSHVIRFWNGSVGGYGTDEFIAKDVDIIQHPTTVDHVIVAVGHNEDSTEAGYQALLDVVVADWPDAEVTMVAQNPWLTNDPWAAGVYDIVVAVAAEYAAGLVDVWSAFTALGDFSSYMADNEHPGATGIVVWVDETVQVWTGGAMSTWANRARLWMPRGSYDGSGDWLDRSGGGHNGTLFGPRFLPAEPGKRLYFPGVGGSERMTCPSISAYNPTDLDVRVRVRIPVDNWAGGTAHTLFQRYSGDPNRQFQFGVTALGGLILSVTPTGSYASNFNSNSTVVVPFLEDEAGWVRATLDVDNGAGAYEVKFYTSYDGVEWTQLGATIVGGATTTLASVTSVVVLGSAISEMDFFSAQMMSGIDGTAVLDVDTSEASEGSLTFVEQSVNAATVTIGTNAAGYGTVLVDGDCFTFDGADDRIEVADHADLNFGAADPLTVLVVARGSHASLQGVTVGKALSTSAGWAGYLLWYANGGLSSKIDDGTTRVISALGLATAIRETFHAAVVRDVANDHLLTHVDGVAGTPVEDTTSDSLTTTYPLHFGTMGNGTLYFQGEIMAVGIVPEALTTAEIAEAFEVLGGATSGTFVLLGRRPAVHVGALR